MGIFFSRLTHGTPKISSIAIGKIQKRKKRKVIAIEIEQKFCTTVLYRAYGQFLCHANQFHRYCCFKFVLFPLLGVRGGIWCNQVLSSPSSPSLLPIFRDLSPISDFFSSKKGRRKTSKSPFEKSGFGARAHTSHSHLWQFRLRSFNPFCYSERETTCPFA